MKFTHPALTLASLCAAALAALACGAAIAHGGADPSNHDTRELIAQVRAATQPFQDVTAADAAGYKQFLGCVDEPGRGAMGIHYLNGSLVEDAVVDPLRPEALMYEPRANGTLELLGVEYIVFQAGWDEANLQPPTLFGHPFHLVREPNRYGVPSFYELHLWLYKHNTGSLFDDWNPRVECP
jgi:hypothetical protein